MARVRACKRFFMHRTGAEKGEEKQADGGRYPAYATTIHRLSTGLPTTTAADERSAAVALLRQRENRAALQRKNHNSMMGAPSRPPRSIPTSYTADPPRYPPVHPQAAGRRPRSSARGSGGRGPRRPHGGASPHTSEVPPSRVWEGHRTPAKLFLSRVRERAGVRASGGGEVARVAKSQTRIARRAIERALRAARRARPLKGPTLSVPPPAAACRRAGRAAARRGQG